MIAAIPYFPGYADYDRLVKAVRKHGRQEGHCVLVVSRREDEEEAMDLEDELKESFSHHVHRVVDPPSAPGRYAMSNEMFRQVLWYMDRHEPGKGERAGEGVTGGRLPGCRFCISNQRSFHRGKDGWTRSSQSSLRRGLPWCLPAFSLPMKEGLRGVRFFSPGTM